MYPDSLIEIAIEHEGEIPVAKGVSNNKNPVRFLKENLNLLLNNSSLMGKVGYGSSEFRQEALLTYFYLLSFWATFF